MSRAAPGWDSRDGPSAHFSPGSATLRLGTQKTVWWVLRTHQATLRSAKSLNDPTNNCFGLRSPQSSLRSSEGFATLSKLRGQPVSYPRKATQKNPPLSITVYQSLTSKSLRCYRIPTLPPPPHTHTRKYSTLNSFYFPVNNSANKYPTERKRVPPEALQHAASYRWTSVHVAEAFGHRSRRYAAPKALHRSES